MKNLSTKKTPLSFLAPYGYIAPISLILLVFVVGSAVIGILFSFTKYNILTPPVYNGITNYKRMLTDQKLLVCLINTLKIVLITVPAQLVLSTLLATLIASRRKSFIGKLSKAVIFIPVLSSTAIVGTVWRALLNGNISFVSNLFSFFGINSSMLLGSSDTAIIVLSFIMVWKQLGYYMVLNLSALFGIPESYYEAAKVDGSGIIYTFFHITLPLLKPAIIMNTFLSIISSLQTFDLSYTMTGGGPSMSTTTLVMYAYDLTFKSGKAGYSMAVSNLLFLIIITAVVMQRGLMKREASEI